MKEQKEMIDIELPTQITKAERVNPKTMVIFGLAKCGKTTELSKLPNNLIIDVEDGTEFVDSLKLKVPKDLGPVGKFAWLNKVAQKIHNDGHPYDYVTIDTFSELDSLAEWNGTFRYMNSSQGVKFNRDATGKMLPYGHPDYESVQTLPNGYGYRWSRDEIMSMYDVLCNLGKICTIFVCHVADKSIVSKLTNQEVVTRDISLVGKTRDILARKVDAIGYLYNEEGKAMISFKGNEEKIGGNRAKHLAGYDGPLDWNKIFIK